MSCYALKSILRVVEAPTTWLAGLKRYLAILPCSALILRVSESLSSSPVEDKSSNLSLHFVEIGLVIAFPISYWSWSSGSILSLIVIMKVFLEPLTEQTLPLLAYTKRS